MQIAEPIDLEVEWVRRAALGDHDAYTSLVHRYQPRLYPLLVRRLGRHAADAEDAVQETFVRAFRALDRYDPRYRFSTWLFTIGLRVAIDMLRAHQRRPTTESNEHLLQSAADSAADRYSRPCDDAEDLWSSIQRWLSEPQATALWLRYAEGMHVAEIARVLGKTQVGVRVLLHRARSQLRKKMDRPLGSDADSTWRAPQS